MQGGQKSGALIKREAKAGEEEGAEHRWKRPGSAEGNDENAITSLRDATLRRIPAKGAMAPLAHCR